MTAPPLPTEPSELEMIDGTHRVLDLVAGRWSVDVVYLLAGGTRRYSEIYYEIGEISKKTLTQTLRSLERSGIVKRQAFAEVPVRVEYSLGARGWRLTRLLMTVYEWSVDDAPAERPEALYLAASRGGAAAAAQRLAA